MRMRLFTSLAALSLTFSVSAFACDDEGEGHGSGKHGKHGKHHAASNKSHHSSDAADDEHSVKIESAAETLNGSVSMHVSGMMCSSCKTKLEAAMKKIPEVETVTADVKSKSMTLTLKSPLSKESLAQAVKSAGFHPL